MIFLKIILPLGWLVGARYYRSLCRCSVISRRYEIRKFGWRLFGHSYMIVGWQPTYVYTARHFRHCIAWWHLPVASSALVFHAVGRRASSYFLGPGRARATTAAAPMTLLRPASFPLPRQHSPAVIQRRHAIRYYFRYVEHYILHNRSYFSIFLCPTIVCLSIFWSKRRTFRKRNCNKQHSWTF